MLKNNRLIFCSIIIFITVLSLQMNTASAQPECRSMLGAHLTPFHKKIPLSWAIEETFAQGWMTDRNITNNLLYLGLDFTHKSHNVYFEGGAKMWRNSLGKYGNNSKPIKFSPLDRGKLGLRESYYMFSHKSTNLILGLHTTTLDDYFLVDERAIGIDFTQKFGAFGINANLSTVMEDFTKMGNYCTVKYIYNTIKSKNDPYIGETFGETNFASLVLTWTPSQKGTWKNDTEDFNEFEEFDENKVDEFEEFDENKEDEFDEFNEDEFEVFDENKEAEFEEFDEFDEFEETNEDELEKPKKKNVSINKYGLVLYEEFGDSVAFNKHYFGFLIGFNLPWKATLEVEALDQLIENEHTIGYFLRLKKNFMWKPGITSLNITYTGKYPNNDNSTFYPGYSNLFMGEIMRLDVWDMPMISASLKQDFNSKYIPHFRIKFTEQLKYPNTGAIDLELGMKFLKHCKLTAIFSRIHSKALTEINYMARFELRIAF